MKKTAFMVIIITLLSKIFGFIREITLSFMYGASYISDAYLISITIPSVIFGFVSTGLAAGYIPMYSKIINQNGDNEAFKFTNNLINMFIFFCSIIVFLGFIYTEQIVRIFASGFDTKTLELAVKFTKASLFAIYFTGLVSILSGYLQIKNNYIIPALVGIPLNIIIVLSIVLSKSTNITIMGIGFVIASASQILIMVPSLIKNKYKYKFVLDFKNKDVLKMVNIIAPVILGVSVNQINVLVDRTIASRIAIGGISALNYANRLNGFVLGIFVLSIITVLYPDISKMVAEKNTKALKKSISESITVINLLIIPSMVGIMIFTNTIVSSFFGRGEFNQQAVNLTSTALFFYSLGMIGFALRELLTRVFYSMQDTKTPMKNAAIGLTINIVLNLILSRYIGVGGLALATSIGATFTTFLLFINIRKKIGQFGLKQISISFIKILFASLIMGLFSKVTFNYLILIFSQNLSLLIAIVIGAISYFLIIYFMKIEEVDVIIGAFKKKLGREVV